MSEAMTETPMEQVWRCDKTGNPCGTDTVPLHQPCQCQACRMARKIEALSSPAPQAGGEVLLQRVYDAAFALNRHAVERAQLKCPICRHLSETLRAGSDPLYRDHMYADARALDEAIQAVEDFKRDAIAKPLPQAGEEGLRHDDLCRLSRLFNQSANLDVRSRDFYINEWLKRQIAEAAGQPPPKYTDWQPTDTAPKDGTRVMLRGSGYSGHEKCEYIGFWDGARWTSDEGYEWKPNAWREVLASPTPADEPKGEPDIPRDDFMATPMPVEAAPKGDVRGAYMRGISDAAQYVRGVPEDETVRCTDAFLSTLAVGIDALSTPSQDEGEALRRIVALECVPFVFPADWQEQIDACPECRRYKDHPIQRGICDEHRKPIYARERHDDHQQRTLIYRAKDIAREALSRSPAPPAQGGE